MLATALPGSWVGGSSNRSWCGDCVRHVTRADGRLCGMRAQTVGCLCWGEVVVLLSSCPFWKGLTPLKLLPY